MGPIEQNQHFAELRQNVCLYIDTQGSAPNSFAKFEWQTRRFWHKKSGKSGVPNSSQTNYNIGIKYGSE